MGPFIEAGWRVCGRVCGSVVLTHGGGDKLSIFLEWKPFLEGKTVYSWSGNLSKEGRKSIPIVGTDHRREESLLRHSSYFYIRVAVHA